MKTTSLYFSEFEKIKFGFIQQKLVLILQKNKFATYITVPKAVIFNVFTDRIDFTTVVQNLSAFNLFFKSITLLKTSFNLVIKRKLILQGLGFKIEKNESNLLSFKLGYSHSINLFLPDFIKQVKVNKNVLVLDASDKILLGDFITKIYNLRKMDSYKEKGFSYPYTVKKLKIIKKK